MKFTIAFAEPIPRGRWMKPANTAAAARAHFVLEETGESACQRWIESFPQLSRACAPWVDPAAEQHLCGMCRRIKPQRCMCPRCLALEISKLAAARRRALLHKQSRSAFSLAAIERVDHSADVMGDRIRGALGFGVAVAILAAFALAVKLGLVEPIDEREWGPLNGHGRF